MKAHKKRGLGMGLSALLAGEDDLAPAAGTSLQQVPIEFLQPSPFQPRRRFDEEELTALADSIRTKGVLQPLVVRQLGEDTFEIIAGERRWRAAQRAELHVLPVVTRALSDREALEIALIENLQRADLNAIEEAQAFARLMSEFGHTQEALAEALGKSRSHIANMLRLLKLPEKVRVMVEDGRLSAGHARALLAVERPEEAATAVVEQKLTVRDVEALGSVRKTAKRAAEGPTGRDPNLAACEERLSRRLGLRVRIRSGRRGGTLTIAYSDLDQLQAVLDCFDAPDEE